MVIHLDPRHVRLNPGASGKASQRRKEVTQQLDAVITPSRAHVNYVPVPESLRTLISNALVALKRGITWDRGSILNLLV